MSDLFSSSETFWERILSRDPAQIHGAFRSIDLSSQTAVLDHLRAMAEEDGWHPQQRESARAALAALEKTA